MTPEAKDFLTYDYAETKDLAKSFLTLISAILVFSIAFSDKIIEFPKAGRAARVLLFMGWGLFAASIILCGIAICFNYQAELIAVHERSDGVYLFVPFTTFVHHFDQGAYEEICGYAGTLMFFAGISFVLGVVSLLMSAVKSASARTAATATSEATSAPTAPVAVIGTIPDKR